MTYVHIRFTRDEPVRERHRSPSIIPRFLPPDIPSFATRLRSRLTAMRQDVNQHEVEGFDDRLLLRVTLREGESLSTFSAIESINGISIVSQEDKEIILAMATDAGLTEVETRLTSLITTGNTIRKDVFFAIDDISRWTPENRKGDALEEQGFPRQESFILDIELWPLENPRERRASLQSFRNDCTNQQIEILDFLDQPSLLMIRVRIRQDQAEALLNYRDVRTIDLPPRVGLAMQTILTDINQFPEVPTPPANAPRIAVLDSGINTQHPMLGPAIGDNQGFVLPERHAFDDSGHGTFVAGIALYGNVEEQIRQGVFTPELQLFSGRVFNDDGQDQTGFVEKSVEAATRYFHETYQCRVFNLSYGDLNKVYNGRHVRGMAYTLDRLTRELGILFVVSTGNLQLGQLPNEPLQDYPNYLLQPTFRLIDPAPALNVVTVGGLATTDMTFNAQRMPGIEDFPIARALQPSPITRSGFSIGNAIKPDFVEAAGNVAVMRNLTNTRHQGLGVVSMNAGFATGRPFREDIGTSFAAPRVAHLAAKLAHQFQNNSINLVRAILACHANWPVATTQLLNSQNNAEGKESLLRLIGYGCVNAATALASLDQVVTLYAEDLIPNDRSHFYELPVPDELWSEGRRERQITVALAYSPDVRTTRLDYRRTKLSFTLIRAATLDEVANAFTHGRMMGLTELATGRTISSEARNKATLQSSRWTFMLPPRTQRQKLFVVITRKDASWSTTQDTEEPYALSVVIQDRGNTAVNLYARVETLLQARGQARERTRARV